MGVSMLPVHRRWAEGASAADQIRSWSWCGRCLTAWPARSRCRSAPGAGRCPGSRWHRMTGARFERLPRPRRSRLLGRLGGVLLSQRRATRAVVCRPACPRSDNLHRNTAARRRTSSGNDTSTKPAPVCKAVTPRTMPLTPRTIDKPKSDHPNPANNLAGTAAGGPCSCAAKDGSCWVRCRSIARRARRSLQVNDTASHRTYPALVRPHCLLIENFAQLATRALPGGH